MPPTPSFQPDTPTGPTRNFAQKAAGFLGIEEFGQRIGSELVRFTPEYKELIKRRDKGLISQDEIDRITSGGISDKEAAASFGLLAANLFAPAFIGKALGTGARGAGVAASGTTGLTMGALDAIKEDRDITKAALTTGAISAAVPVVGRGLSRAAGSGSTALASLFQGTPKAFIEKAAKNPNFPRAFRTVLNDDDAVPKALNSMERALKSMQDDVNPAFRRGLKDLAKTHRGKKISTNSVAERFENNIRNNTDFGFTFDRAAKSVASSDPRFTKDDLNLVRRMYRIMLEKRELGLQDAVIRKQAIEGIFPDNPRLKNVFAKAVNSFDDEMFPAFRGLQKLEQDQFASRKIVDAMRTELKLGRGGGRQIQILNAVTRAFKRDDRFTQDLLEVLKTQGAEDSLDIIIASAFKDAFPVGAMSRILSAVVFGAGPLAVPALGGGAVLASPRVTGEFLARTAGARGAEVAPGVAGAVRTGIANIARNITGQ